MPEGSKPMGVGAAPDGKRIYVSNGRGGTVSVIDPATDSVVAQREGRAAAVGHRAHPRRREALRANGPSNDVSVVDAEGLTVEQDGAGGQAPVGRGARPGAVIRPLGRWRSWRAARGPGARAGPSAFAVDPGGPGRLHALWSASVAAQRRAGGLPGERRSTATRCASPGSCRSTPAPIPWRSPRAASLETCGPPDWQGTVHTHIAAAAGRRPTAFFSGADRGRDADVVATLEERTARSACSTRRTRPTARSTGSRLVILPSARY